MPNNCVIPYIITVIDIFIEKWPELCAFALLTKLHNVLFPENVILKLLAILHLFSKVQHIFIIDVNTFLRFFIRVTFLTFFGVFYLSTFFIFKKRSLKIPKFEKHF